MRFALVGPELFARRGVSESLDKDRVVLDGVKCHRPSVAAASKVL